MRLRLSKAIKTLLDIFQVVARLFFITPTGLHCYASLLCYRYMTTREKVEFLISQAAELPDEAQAELVQSLVEMRSQHLGIYSQDDDERDSLAYSAGG
jgi:hypothetical protein